MPDNPRPLSAIRSRILLDTLFDRYIDVRRIAVLDGVGRSLSEKQFNLAHEFQRNRCILRRDR